MKKKRKNLGKMGGMMGRPPMRPDVSSNPIVLITKFPALAETSLVDQTETKLSLTNRHISLINNFNAIGSQFAFIVNVLIYDPINEFAPMAVVDTITDSSGIPQSRIYHLAFQNGFGKNDNAYCHAMFYISNVPPVEGNITFTVKHPACKRRIVTVEQWANLSSSPLDQQAVKTSSDPGIIQITSGLTSPTSQPFELIYGSIAIGRDFDQFTEPLGFTPIQNVGSNIDTFDTTLKTYYKLSSVQDNFGLAALVSNNNRTNNFVWSAGLQTFKSIQL